MKTEVDIRKQLESREKLLAFERRVGDPAWIDELGGSINALLWVLDEPTTYRGGAGRALVAGLLEYLDEWTESRTDGGCCVVYCKACGASGEFLGRTSSIPPVREHEPNCKLKALLDSARKAAL